jgi:hypothetical protein
MKKNDKNYSDVDYQGYKAIALACDNGDTLPASPAEGQWFLLIVAGVRTLYQYQDAAWVNYVQMSVLEDTKEPTGWLDPAGVEAVITYDSTARIISMSGTHYYYWRGIKKSVTNFVSAAHDLAYGIYYLYSTDGDNFVWSNTEWSFDMLMLAAAVYKAGFKYGGSEGHGMMQWQVHEELHQTIGTYKSSGGVCEPSSYVIGSIIAADRRPDVVETILRDEDIPHTLLALTSQLYNKFYLSGADVINYSGETAEILLYSGSQPYYNLFTGGVWTQSLMANNSYSAFWLVAQPTTKDVNSQAYRFSWIQAQSNGSLVSQQALTTDTVSLSEFTSDAAEFVFLQKIIVQYIGGNWSIEEIDTLSGTRAQVSSPSGNFLTVVTTDTTLTGAGTTASPLSVDHEDVTGLLGGAADDHYHLTGAQATDLTDAGDSTLHYHATDRSRANHTGTQTASTISDFAATVRATVLTGLSLATNAVISATDTVLSALGKLQAQITGLSAVYAPIAKGVTNGDSHNHSGGDGADIEPQIIGDEATIKQRKDSGLTLFYGFDNSTLPAGFAWAGAPFTTPSTVDFTTYSSFMRLVHPAAYRGFLYRSTITAAGLHPTIIVGFSAGTGFAGLRMDDGTDNNYFEWLLSTDLKATIKTRVGGGIISTLQGASMVIPQIYGIRGNRTGTFYSSWGANVWITMPWQGALIQQVQAVSALTTASWTPTRMGVVTDMSSANAVVLVDALLEF